MEPTGPQENTPLSPPASRTPLGGRDLLPVAALAVFLALYFLPAVRGGLLLGGEDLPQFYAMKSGLYRLSHGLEPWSLWNELPGLGVSRLGNPQVGYLSPFSLWFYLVPTARAMSLYPALLLLALGTATYGFLRLEGLDRGPSAFGALGWVGLGPLLEHVHHPPTLEGLTWLPVVLACWTWFRRGGGGRALAGGGLAVAAMVFAGHLQYLVYSSCLVAGWIGVSLVARPDRGRLAGALAMAAVGLLVSAPLALPAVDFGSRSQRTLLEGAHFADQFRLTGGELARQLAAEGMLVEGPILQVHGGYRLGSGLSLLTVALALFGAWKDRRLRVALAGAALFLLGTLGTDGPVMGLLQHLPGAGLLRAPLRMVVPAGFLLAWASAWGLQRLGPARVRPALAAGACAWLLVLWWTLHHGELRYESPEVLAPPEAVTSLGEGRLALDFLTLPQQLVNCPLVAGVPTLVVYDPVVPRNWFEALFSSQLGSLANRSKVERAMALGNMIPVVHPDRPLLRSFDLRRLVTKQDGAFVARPVPPAGGRFFVVPRVRVAPTPEERHALAASDGWDPVQVAVVAEPVPEGTGGRVEVLEDRPDRQDLLVEGGGGLLVVSGLYEPGWKAWVDGRPAGVVEANLALRAVPVPAGSHRVSWRYQPWWRMVAPLLAFAGLLLALLLALRLWNPARPDRTG